MRSKKRIGSFDLFLYIFLGIISIITLFPFYNVLIISFAKFEVISKSTLYLFPKSFDFTAYKMVCTDPKFWNASLISIFVTIVGVSFNMLISVAGAYALSKKDMPGRNIILTGILFTMFFSGGLIPYYLVIKSLGLVNNILVMIIPAGINTMYLIIMKNYFSTLPESLEESAKIDGAGDIYILFKIILPISAPFIATFALFYAVERWNEWWYALMFINDSVKAPLQIYLRELLITFNSMLNDVALNQAQKKFVGNIYFPSLQMSAVVITSVPILLVYPFLQKHFAKGVMIGSIKG